MVVRTHGGGTSSRVGSPIAEPSLWAWGSGRARRKSVEGRSFKPCRRSSGDRADAYEKRPEHGEIGRGGWNTLRCGKCDTNDGSFRAVA